MSRPLLLPHNNFDIKENTTMTKEIQPVGLSLTDKEIMNLSKYRTTTKVEYAKAHARAAHNLEQQEIRSSQLLNMKNDYRKRFEETKTSLFYWKIAASAATIGAFILGVFF